MTKTPIAAVVLAAGKGTRMGSDLHKVLHPLARRPRLGHFLDSLEVLGASRRVVIVGAGENEVTGVNSQEELATLDLRLAAKSGVHA